MNLLTDPWLPVRRRNSTERIWIAPSDATGDYDKNPVVALEAPRPDFNGALMQFLVGLLQTACPPKDEPDWEDRLDQPLSAKELSRSFTPHSAAFAFDGDGARFGQDLSLKLADGEPKPISALLIEAPGAQAFERNTDHFVKRDFVKAICWPCATAALVTLHTNAPSGGAGHRTSLRGGGPLTTLVVGHGATTLWRDVWMNVLPEQEFLAIHPGADRTEPHYSYPWLAEQSVLQTEQGEISPGQVHPLQLFWAMPRRIRLDLSGAETGRCDLCGEPDRKLTRAYVTKNYGLNYKGAWRHPLTPYAAQRTPGQPAFPVHPQPGGIGYRHWVGWVLGNARGVQPAKVVTLRGSDDARRLWAFGFDMDNMKARGWQDGWLPLFSLRSARERDALAIRTAQCVEAASLATFLLRSALKAAWFASPGDARGDYSFADTAFWSATERPFYDALERIVAAVRRGDEVPEAEWNQHRERWRKVLEREALRLFQHFVDSGDPAAGDLRRRAEAYRALKASLTGKKIREALGLPVEAKSRKGAKRAAAAQT